MTNKEILQADLLDILFENRNKEYGAYALRKTYPHRLLWALGISLGTVLSFLLFGFPSTENSPGAASAFSMDGPKLRTIDLAKPDQPIPRAHAQQHAASTSYTSQIRIVPENVTTSVPEMRQLDETTISDATRIGITPGNNPASEGSSESAAVKPTEDATVKPVEVSSTDAQFPGGPEAFRKFLARWLVVPGDLEVGEKKVVLVRFMVDAMGNISKAEVVQSDGEAYTKEVLRVMGKMPKWIPATQNGIKMATWFVQPVSFIGIEQ